jgi:hypothetical protein
LDDDIVIQNIETHVVYHRNLNELAAARGRDKRIRGYLRMGVTGLTVIAAAFRQIGPQLIAVDGPAPENALINASPYAGEQGYLSQ